MYFFCGDSLVYQECSWQLCRITAQGQPGWRPWDMAINLQFYEILREPGAGEQAGLVLKGMPILKDFFEP